MQPESRVFLYDIRHAAELILQFTTDKSFAEMLRSAVERQFGIIGEAINHLSRVDPEITARINEYQDIIAFRNILVHRYAQVDDQAVWGILTTQLPVLFAAVQELLEDNGGT